MHYLLSSAARLLSSSRDYKRQVSVQRTKKDVDAYGGLLERIGDVMAGDIHPVRMVRSDLGMAREACARLRCL